MLPFIARMGLWKNSNTMRNILIQTTAITTMKRMPYKATMSNSSISSIHTSIILGASTKPKPKLIISKAKVKTPPKCSILKSEDHKILQEKQSDEYHEEAFRGISDPNSKLRTRAPYETK